MSVELFGVMNIAAPTVAATSILYTVQFLALQRSSVCVSVCVHVCLCGADNYLYFMYCLTVGREKFYNKLSSLASVITEVVLRENSAA